MTVGEILSYVFAALDAAGLTPVLVAALILYVSIAAVRYIASLRE